MAIDSSGKLSITTLTLFVPLVQNHEYKLAKIIQEWGDKRNVNDLYKYLTAIDQKRERSDYFWVAMAELTPSTVDVLFRPNDGLRKLADQVVRNVTAWYRDLWWRTTSTVAVDFFRSTDIIDVAVDASIKRSRCSGAEVQVTTPTSTSTTQQLIAEERSDRRWFYQGPRSLNLDVTENTTETTTAITSAGTTKSFRITVRRRRPKNTTLAASTLAVTTAPSSN